MKHLVLLALMAASLVSTAWARDAGRDDRDDDRPPLAELTPQTLPQQREAVMDAFAPGERFAELDEAGRKRVIESFDRMQALMGGATSIDQLEPDVKVDLFNEQAMLNEVLTQAQRDSRVTCKRYRTVNSRLKNGECHTAAEWERRRERARKLWDMNKRSVSCPSDSNGSFASCQ